MLYFCDRKKATILDVQYLPHSATDAFSKLVNDYLSGEAALTPFYRFTPDEKGLAAAIEARAGYPVNREVLTGCLRQQYSSLAMAPAVARNIDALSRDNTYTVCTAHQPNLMTGYLYFFYKIIHAVKLADFLQEKFPDKNFVPVYYMGSEDNDLDELRVFRYEGTTFKWDTQQTGAVGRMSTTDLHDLIDALKLRLGPPNEHTSKLKEVISEAYQQQPTIAAATRYLINELLGHFGVVVLDADAAALKRQWLELMKQELIAPVSDKLVTATSGALRQNYSDQAYVRPINFFYLDNDVRARIEYNEDRWQVLHTDIEWTERELIDTLNSHPERFSPNVILRGVYQESILPNVAFIGGGSEVAYWMQLKSVFDHYHVFFPPLILRQSVLWIDGQAGRLQEQLGLSDPQLFEDTDALKSAYATRHSSVDISLDDLRDRLSDIGRQMSQRAVAVDPTLEASVAAAITRMNHQFSRIEKKMLRGVKRKSGDALHRIDRLKALLFPDGVLQERRDCFLEYYIAMGSDFFDVLRAYTLPLGNRFLIVKYGTEKSSG